MNINWHLTINKIDTFNRVEIENSFHHSFKFAYCWSIQHNNQFSFCKKNKAIKFRMSFFSHFWFSKNIDCKNLIATLQTSILFTNSQKNAWHTTVEKINKMKFFVMLKSFIILIAKHRRCKTSKILNWNVIRVFSWFAFINCHDLIDITYYEYIKHLNFDVICFHQLSWLDRH